MTGTEEFEDYNLKCCGAKNITCDYYDNCLQRDFERLIKLALDRSVYDTGYNTYQACYKSSGSRKQTRKFMQQLWPKHNYPSVTDKINYDSTDTLAGFPCWNDAATTPYMNSDVVKRALHVRNGTVGQWSNCGSIRYTNQYDTMEDVLRDVINMSKGDVRILIYNGDVDMVCNFLGDEWFADRVAANNQLPVVAPRAKWIFRGDSAGYVKRYKNFDVLTVQGSGHFVPTDRSGPALQMLVNFLRNSDDYNSPTGLNTTPRPMATGSPDTL